MASSSSSSPPGWKCRQISLDEIKDATDNFSQKNFLGKGGEGNVYMGEIRVNQKMTQVAVKRLSKPEFSEGFEREIKIVSNFQHPNVVSLLGYCEESGEKILLYEYMEKGSLSSHMKEKSYGLYLSWQQRLRICLDAARGLQHLHAETNEYPKGIIHRDVKPDNILLDKNWVAKISDFGILKLSHVGQMQSTMATGLKGTGRYFAPEYVMNNHISRAADVYAFGVVLFQVLCLIFHSDRGGESYYSTEDEDLGIWAEENIDSRIKEEIHDDSLKAFTTVIGKSLKMDSRKRPTMDGVVLGLENALKLQMDEDEAENLRGGKENVDIGIKGNATDRVVVDLENVLKFQEIEDEVKRLQSAPRLPGQKYFDHISLDEIKYATDNFDKRKLVGQRGSETEAVVYLAVIRLGRIMTQVAVKRFLDLNSFGGSDSFETEIHVLSKFRHRNIMSLLGYCDESGEKILLYEYMEKGSLSSYVDKNNSISLTWRQRLSICLDAARGLQHLHTVTDEFPKGMVHRGVKPSNILIDNNWEAKISDFGLVKLSHIGQKESEISTSLKGTSGYLAPEYISYRSITRKIDVYAFGMVLIQVLCLKGHWDREEESYYNAEEDDLGIWALKNIDTRTKKEISDDSLKILTAIIGKSSKIVPRKRPTMDEVVSDLENALKCQDDEHEAKKSQAVREYIRRREEMSSEAAFFKFRRINKTAAAEGRPNCS